VWPAGTERFWPCGPHGQNECARRTAPWHEMYLPQTGWQKGRCQFGLLGGFW
jgi:hypothetical protein